MERLKSGNLKIFIGSLVLTFFIFNFIGCAGKRESSTRELIMWLVGSESQAKAVDALGKEFFKPGGLGFRCEAISWGDAHAKYLTSIAGGVVPDIGMMGLTWGTEFGTLGAMIDIAAAYPEDLEKIKKEVFPGLWQSCQYKGHAYGIPFDLSEHVMFYRSDLVKAVPQNWEELTRLLSELKAQGKGMIFDWGSLEWIGFAPFLWQAGGDFYNQEGSASVLDSAQAEAALKFFSQLYTQCGVPKTRIPIEQGMRTGDFPLAISGNWEIDGLRLGAPEIEGKWAIALLPAGTKGRRTAFIGGRIMGIFSQSQKKKQAWEFIKFLFTPAVQVKLYEAAIAAQDTYLPPNMDTWSELPLSPNFKQILKLQALDTKGPPSVLGWDQSTRFIDEAIQRVVLQGADPKEELAKTKKELDQHIVTR
jgi:ABC-type glycerol-3-phosphate transport system substrate-binding protein